MEISLNTLLFICPMIFLAGFIDAIAGGGGLISLPTYILAGLPPHFAYGTNKFSSGIGTTFSVFRFIKNKRIHIKSASVSIVAALIGSALGVRLTLWLDEKYLQYILLILLPVIAIFVLSRKNFGLQERQIEVSERKVTVLSILSGLIIGAYDGFFGPGTGAFYILIYTSMMGFNLTTASGNSKIVNLASNLAAITTFIISGKVVFVIGIPAAICGILGNWIGSGLALKNGAKVIKPVFVGVLILLFVKISYDLFSSVL